MKRIDDAVRRILRIKFRAGLFDHVRYNHVDNRQTPIPQANRAAARWAAAALDGAAQERRRHAAVRRRPRRPR